MSRVHTKAWFVSSGLLFTCLAAEAAGAKVVVSFTGVVEEVMNLGANPPAGVAVGQPVSGSLSYDPADGQRFEMGPSEVEYTFVPSGGNVFQVTIAGQTWTTSLLSIGVCDDACGGDYLNFGGAATMSPGFPAFLGIGAVGLE